jgi:hypothetical protein
MIEIEAFTILFIYAQVLVIIALCFILLCRRDKKIKELEKERLILSNENAIIKEDLNLEDVYTVEHFFDLIEVPYTKTNGRIYTEHPIVLPKDSLIKNV